MLTKWGKIIAGINNAVIDRGNNIPMSISQTTEAMIQSKLISGDTVYVNSRTANTSNTELIKSALNVGGSSQGSSNGVAIGSGNSPESENDYTLDSQITGFDGSITVSTVVDTQTHRYILRRTITITNETGEDFTIREVGLFGSLYSASNRGDAASSSRSVMIDRTLIEQPVLVPNGEARVIRYDIAYDTD